MSDKSFGDLANRNIVKNPLLSTAVTGLSIEDLTHNAVLLPALPGQELTARQDKQQGVQMHTPRYTNSEFTNVPYGDAKPNTIQFNPPVHIDPPLSNVQTFDQFSKIPDIPSASQSKAPSKSDDDFDVNEYFARLQGTRYVSAPINSIIKEDQSANLQEEENLEEINLNEPDKGQSLDDVQQSLTADIAQNFSQLPTVIPQMASVVFSSFSNMLSLKNREQTPDVDNKVYQEPVQKVNNTPMMMNMPEMPKDIAPPPLKEPPTGIATSYRMTTKKKVYAQIPGLSSGDHHVPTFNPPPSSHAPPNYFVPDNVQVSQYQPEIENTVTVEPRQHSLAPQTGIEIQHDISQTTEKNNIPNIFNPVDNDQKQNMGAPPDLMVPTQEKQSSLPKQEHITMVDTTNQSITMFNAPSTPIIPPPPMFSNMRRDSQTSSGKSVLPPSIARRISGSQPVIKTQAIPCFVPHENILMPTIPDPTDTSTRVSESTGQNLNQVSNQHSEVTNILPPNPYSNLNTLILPPSNASWNKEKDLVASDALYPESNVSQNDVYNAATMPAYTLFCTEPVVPANSNIFLDTKHPSSSDKYIEQETVSASNISSITADYFNPHLKDEKVNEIPVVVNSSAFTQAHVDMNRMDNILSVPQVQMSHNFQANTPAEAVKPLTEPPKLTGNVNYRMSNKRPQYYSGPIEGVGSIGGNINPIERPIERIPTLPTLEQIYFKASSAPYTHFMTPANTSNYLQNEPFDISKPMNAPYSSNNSAQQEQQFNTAFDLSRPTTDSHDKQTQDSKNFGIIGSLKSKINSLDVIKNTITNLLDPSFNVSRNNDSVNQDNDSHPENYTIEEDVQGNVVESVPSLTNNPKPPDEPSHNSNHLNPKIEIKYLSYGYYGDPNHQHPVRSRPPHSSILQNVILKNSVNQNAPLNQDINRTISESGQAEETMLNPKLDSGITTSSEQGEFSLNNRKDNIEYVSTKSDTGILMPKIFEYSDVNVPMKTGAASIQENNILNYSNKDQFQSKGNPPEHTPPTTATDNEKRNNSPRDFFNDLPKISQVLTDPSSKGFFDKETSIVLPFEAKKFEENINKSVITPELNLSKINISSNIQPCNKLVKNQESCELNLLEKKTTLQSSDLKHIPESILPPVELIKEDESKDYSLFRSDNTTANNINSAPMFSLFENSHLPAIPLFDISTLATNPLSIPTNINDMNDLQMKKENTSIFQSTDTAQDQNIFENLNTEVKENLVESPISELNICETCREVKKPEEKEVEDLTTQLIENITAPIQLENPVEFPVGEDFVEDQLVKVGPEGTIDIMKAQPPDDLLNDTKVGNAMLNYGWSTNETSQSTKALTDHDYGFQIDPKSVGFLVQEKCVFLEDIPANASDEIKAEFQNSYEDTILPRQMSMPSAPPEEDSKSDESGLDVHSIEQDAKKDFPIFEEFVVEPSETDDHKIEYRQSEKNSDNSEPAVDTFTNRVERFKKDKDNTNEIKKEIKTFDLPTSTSPAITIASYFDTGNYAVENHYKNSLTSPSSLNTFNTDSNAAMRIPPGFEEEYHRRLSEISSQDILPVLKIQNLNVNSVDISPLSTIKPLDDNICDATVESMIKELIEEDSIPAETDNKPASADDSELSNEGSKDKIPEPVNAFESNIIKTEDIKLDSLPDPINFFSSNVDNVQEPDAYSDFSRLSSYFTSPPKPEHSKSFFELSQSQNHYRHKPSKDTFDSMNNNLKMFFENLNSDNNLIQNNQNNNIPQISSQQISLVHDLTSVENLQPIDDIVRTVNYFTIDSITLPGSDLNTHKVTELKQNVPNETDDDKNGNNNFKDTDKNEIENVVNCKYCCQMTDNRVNVANSRFKIRKNMDNNSENQKEANTDVKKEGIRKSMTVNFCDSSHQEDADDRIVVMSENRTSSEYSPVKHHWFYKVEYEGKSIWRGFSVADSRALEIAFNSPDLNDNTLVATDGGRYDVSVVSRLRTAVYWNETPTNVMRCSWFYKGTSIDPRYVPYSEDVAEKLEEEYRHGVTTGEWHRRLMLNNNELVVMHGPSVMVHFVQNSNNDTFATSPQSMMRPRVVRRGYVESEIEDTEPSSIDHLLLLCHGVGSACDMRFRPVEEVVNDFRTTSVQLIQSHYKNSYDSGLVGRVEVLPISWHASLHTGVGVDSRLAAVTLDSIPRLRNFTNDTILDVLFYTSPVFCQLIIDTVCSELNRIYSLFKSRNPDFKGGVSLGGHSLGSVILYDLLCHQLPVSKEQSLTPDKTYITGAAGTGQPCVKYPALGFEPDALYALGSPIAIFECIRGVETLGKDFCLPTCKNFFNIFHPYDPIAYRIEPMINPQLRDVKPYLIPHHKGRKRMHLELKDTMARVGADIKQRVMESIKNTWSSMWKSQPPTDHHLEKVVEEEMEKEELAAECKEDVAKPTEVTADMLGKLNAGRRIDHVLQEAPFEMINEYLFAMSSHVCYWESEDTMLVMLREIYNALGVAPDCSLPQRTLSVERSRTVDDSLALSSESPSTSRSGS